MFPSGWPKRWWERGYDNCRGDSTLPQTPWGSLSLINLHLLSKKRKTNVERSTHALLCYMVYSTQDGLVTSPGTIGTCFIWPVRLLFLAALYFLWHVAWKTLWLKVSRDELLSYQERKRRSYLCTIDSQWCNEMGEIAFVGHGKT